MKSYQKGKSGTNQAGPGFRTADHFKGSIFSGGGSKFSGGAGSRPNTPQAKFNPAQFKTQHKG